jgi:hypothetical protein
MFQPGVMKMRIVHGIVTASLALLMGVSGTAATLSFEAENAAALQRRAAPTAPLVTLSERDLTSTRQMGCTCTFANAGRELVQAIGNELMVRTAAGRQVCRLTDARFQQISGATGSYVCGGVRMTLRKTGRSQSHPESDSYTTPATLTMAKGRTSRTLNGTWGCAC